MSDPSVNANVIADMQKVWEQANDPSREKSERNQAIIQFMDMVIANGGLLFSKAERLEQLEKLIPRMIEATPPIPDVPDEYSNGFRNGWIEACKFIVGWK